MLKWVFTSGMKQLSLQFSSVQYILATQKHKIKQYKNGLAQKQSLNHSASPKGEYNGKMTRTENRSRRPRHQPAEQPPRNQAARHGQRRPGQGGV